VRPKKISKNINKMSSEKFCLRWNDFQSNIIFAFKELRDDKDFFDITIACDDEQIQAHKVILSACSPFFRNILRRNPHQHPLLYLKGVKYTDLQSVLNFMYHGEVNVAQEELNSFLAVAEDLRVKGLTQNQGGVNPNSKRERESYSRPKSPPLKTPTRPPDRDPPPPKRSRPDPITNTTTHPLTSQAVDDDIQEVVPVKSEPRDPPPQPPAPAAQQSIYSHNQPPIHTTQALATPEEQTMQTMVYQEEGYEDYGQYEEDQEYQGGMVEQDMAMEGSKGVDPADLLQYIVKDTASGILSCSLCSHFSHRSRANVRNHIESKHFPNTFVYTCPTCAKECPSHQSLLKHKSLFHKN